jgi:hypothetical protein
MHSAASHLCALGDLSLFLAAPAQHILFYKAGNRDVAFTAHKLLARHALLHRHLLRLLLLKHCLLLKLLNELVQLLDERLLLRTLLLAYYVEELLDRLLFLLVGALLDAVLKHA